MEDENDERVELTWAEKATALGQVVRFRPAFTSLIIILSLVAAILEGFGLSFILPIVDVAQSGGVFDGTSDGILGVFLAIYSNLGVPFTLGYLIMGVVAVMIVRFTTTFVGGWFTAVLETHYVKYLQQAAFNNALDAKIAYFDREGSDDILNAIVTQAEYGGRVVRYALRLVEQGLLACMYLAITLYFAPILTLITAALYGTITFLFRQVIDRGYGLGDKVANSKEAIQSSAQAGTQGVRDVKLYGMNDELRSKFDAAVNEFEKYRVALERNSEAIVNFHQLTTAVTIFTLIYFSLTYSSLTFGETGVFLFAMFRLGPKVSNINRIIYRIEGELPHLIRTQRFVEELKRNRETNEPITTLSTPIREIVFEEVSYGYETSQEEVLHTVSFSLERGEFAAIVGPSGAGKSTVASLLARMYEPDEGRILANGIPIHHFDLHEWRSRISIIRQDPDIFNDTLRRNITVGSRDPEPQAFEEACEIAQVTEFVDDLPDGYDTTLGDQGVRLSGGQRQRVAIARAILKDADVLVLDEATSDLDTTLENRVHRGIEAMERDYAMLVIAHRLSTVTNADRIYAMEAGEIVETGNHDELVEHDGVYANLYSMQS